MKSFSCWSFVCFLSSVAFAQTTSTEILGSVLDPSGASIPGASVVLRRASTGETRQAVTNKDGNYNFPLIDVGEYTIKVTANGFTTQ